MNRFGFLKLVAQSVLSTVLLANILHAGVTGKIRGVIVDKQTRDPLVGVNITIVGTTLGSATDKHGEYFILHVSPGVYTLRVRMIGYKEVVVQDVKVIVDHTTKVDVELEEQPLEIQEEIVITAERPVVQKDVTSSTQFVDIKELEQLPVIDAREGLMLQTGVFLDPVPIIGGLGGSGRGEPRYAIRGGSQDEVKWYIDGIRTAALIEGRADRGGSFTNINLNAIEEVQVISGGYSAEYGEAQSGIVNVVTKEGGDRFSGSVEYIYGVPGQHHFGNFLYDQNTQKEFLDHTLSDGSLDSTWWTPFRNNQIYDYTDIPDHTLYLSFGGPIFRSGQSKGTFFVSSQFKREAYALPHPRDTRNFENVMVNMAFQIKPHMKLRISGLYNHEAHSTLQENGDFTNQAKYYRGWGSLLDTYTYNISAHWTHTLSHTSYYELRLNRFFFDSKENPSDFLELGQSLNPTLFGFQRYDGFEEEPFDAFAPVLRNHLQTGDISLVGSFNWQFDSANLLKTGFEFRYNTMAEKEALRFPSFTLNAEDWINRGLHETFHPIQIAAYIQDKMEFEGMILNLGLRYDYFNPNREWFTSRDLFNLSIDPNYEASKDPDGDQIDSDGDVKYSFENVLNKPRAPVRSYHMVSPRFGVSFPVADQTVLHFNYGYFYQMPPLDRMFEFNYFRPVYIVEGNIAGRNDPNFTHFPSNDGDPERVVFLTLEPLKPEKTISFEVGVKHNFSDFAVLDVTAFYKDVFDQTEARQGLFDRRIYGFDPFRQQITPNVFFVSAFPGDFGDSRGFEVTLRTLFSEIFTLDLNYSFSRATQGRASPGRINIDENGNPEFIFDTEVNKRIPVEKVFSRPNILRANLFLRFPEHARGSFLASLLRDMSASMLYTYISGQTFTFLRPDDPPDTIDNHRLPARQSVDLRVEKALNFGKMQRFSVYTRITNLLNTKNVRSIGDIFFDSEALPKFVETGEVSTTDANGYDISWQTYYEPRRVYFGIRYNIR